MTPMNLAKEIRKYMKENHEEHIDNTTGKVNMTMLVEDCCNFMEGGRGDWLNDPDHIVWEIATEFYDDE